MALDPAEQAEGQGREEIGHSPWASEEERRRIMDRTPRSPSPRPAPTWLLDDNNRVTARTPTLTPI